MRDPYVEFVGKQVEIVQTDGRTSTGVLRGVTYFYAILEREVITRKHIISLRFGNGGAR